MFTVCCYLAVTKALRGGDNGVEISGVYIALKQDRTGPGSIWILCRYHGTRLDIAFDFNMVIWHKCDLFLVLNAELQ